MCVADPSIAIYKAALTLSWPILQHFPHIAYLVQVHGEPCSSIGLMRVSFPASTGVSLHRDYTTKKVFVPAPMSVTMETQAYAGLRSTSPDF